MCQARRWIRLRRSACTGMSVRTPKQGTSRSEGDCGRKLSAWAEHVASSRRSRSGCRVRRPRGSRRRQSNIADVNSRSRPRRDLWSPISETRPGTCVDRYRARLGQRADLHGRAVGTYLLPAATDLRGVEAHRENRVRPSTGGFLHQPLLSLQPAIDQHLGLSAQFTADKGLESGAQLGANVAGTYRQTEDLPNNFGHLEARQVVHGRNDHGVLPCAHEVLSRVRRLRLTCQWERSVASDRGQCSWLDTRIMSLAWPRLIGPR